MYMHVVSKVRTWRTSHSQSLGPMHSQILGPMLCIYIYTLMYLLVDKCSLETNTIHHQA